MVDQAVLPLEQALEVYGDMVVRAAFGMVKNRQDAEDIINLGADRLGTSAIVKLVKGQTPQGY